jgi:hypothetical protein
MAEREDWTLFRTVEGLQQNAGVSASRLRRLVLKEFIDNPLDEGASVEVDNPDGSGLAFFVADDGPGIDGEPEEIANLFSIRRPMRSSKLLRLPRRGALGKPFTICDIPLAAHSPTERAALQTADIVTTPRPSDAALRPATGAGRLLAPNEGVRARWLSS